MTPIAWIAVGFFGSALVGLPSLMLVWRVLVRPFAAKIGLVSGD